jgi:hypothetical protein
MQRRHPLQPDGSTKPTALPVLRLPTLDMIQMQLLIEGTSQKLKITGFSDFFHHPVF